MPSLLGMSISNKGPPNGAGADGGSSYLHLRSMAEPDLEVDNETTCSTKIATAKKDRQAC